MGIPMILSMALAFLFHLRYNKEIKNRISYIKPEGKIVGGIYAIGLRDAITPIVSFNHGMRSRSRVLEGIKYGLLYTLGIMAVGLLLLEGFAGPLLETFGLSKETRGLCISAMRIISVSFLFAGANIAFQGIFQALDSGVESLILSVCRQLVFVLPVAWGLAEIAAASSEKVWLVWWTFPVAEAATAVIACVLMKRIQRKKIQGLEG